MTDTLKDSDFRRYALLGAEARLLQIGQEAASIYQAFPELRKQGRTPGGGERTPDAATTGGRTRRRGRMTAEQREAVRERMKRYWARRRSAGTATQGTASGTQAASSAAETPASGARKSQTARSKSTRGRGGPRKMSAAARKRISDAQKARWAKRKRANA
jgi:hypothetical protein